MSKPALEDISAHSEQFNDHIIGVIVSKAGAAEPMYFLRLEVDGIQHRRIETTLRFMSWNRRRMIRRGRKIAKEMNV